MNKKSFFKLFKEKKGVETETLNQLLGAVLAGVLIIGSVFLFTTKLYASEISQEEQSNLNNFIELVKFINSKLKDKNEKNFRIHLQEGYNIFGFEKGKMQITGNCYWEEWGKLELEKKKVIRPLKCRDLEKDCLCLCKEEEDKYPSKKGGKKMCPDNSPCVEMDFSFKGGKSEKKGGCDFAFVQGGKSHNLYLRREGRIVKICPHKCK